ncbi:MAG: hypothetical protein M3Y45_09580, partial [Actinomycetota bacterium]|nr:hypothetical protein [Actinomycetota bacterium]
ETRERLDHAAVAAGLDAHLVLVHDSSFARGVLNAAASSEASLILATISDEPARAAGSWAEAVAESTPIPTAILKGDIRSLASVRILSDEDCDSAAELAESIGVRVGSHLPGSPSRGEIDGRTESESPEPGELMIRPVRNWNLLAGLPDVPEGAALIAIPDFVVPGPVTAPVEDRSSEAELSGA